MVTVFRELVNDLQASIDGVKLMGAKRGEGDAASWQVALPEGGRIKHSGSNIVRDISLVLPTGTTTVRVEDNGNDESGQIYTEIHRTTTQMPLPNLCFKAGIKSVGRVTSQQVHHAEQNKTTGMLLLYDSSKKPATLNADNLRAFVSYEVSAPELVGADIRQGTFIVVGGEAIHSPTYCKVMLTEEHTRYGPGAAHWRRLDYHFAPPITLSLNGSPLESSGQIVARRDDYFAFVAAAHCDGKPLAEADLTIPRNFDVRAFANTLDALLKEASMPKAAPAAA